MVNFKTSHYIFRFMFLLQISNMAWAECLPAACYVEKVSVVSCEVVSGVIPDGGRLQQLGIHQRQAQTILAESSAVVITGKVLRSRSVAQCAAPDPVRFAGGTMTREYLVPDASCADYPPGYSTEGFVTKACCDTLPINSAQCVLTMEVMGPLPKWAE